MKRVVFLVFVVLLIPSLVCSQGLVTGAKRDFVPGDKVLFAEDFSSCPVGELPQKFEKITGAGECVRYGTRIWFSAINGNTGLLKKIALGGDEFSVEFDVLFLKGECGEMSVNLFSGDKVGEKKLSSYELRIGPGCTGEAVYVGLQKVGRIYKSKYKSLKKQLHVAVQVRRKQFRVFLNGRRLTMVPFSGNVRSVGFFLRGKYSQLISNIRIAKYSNAEERPSPEKLGIKMEKTAGGTKLTIPERVLFDFNKFFLKDKAKEALHVVAGILKENPGKKVRIVGYTDNVGPDAYNLRLSLQRAQSVADYLIYVERVEKDRIKIEGKGKSNPIADNTTEAGRAKNRRVEIEIF